ncbi:MAG: GNAT family N-acetyltransferase [Alphaproteobacteria bacterium]|nr:GNAT family N-acetyltransferase [Alphaproteobacteria bacterium]
MLRPVREDDFDAIHTYAIDPAVYRYMDWGPNTPEITRGVLNGWLEAQKTWPRREVNLGVELIEERVLIGGARLALQAPGNADLGYCYNTPRHRPRGRRRPAARRLRNAPPSTRLGHLRRPQHRFVRHHGKTRHAPRSHLPQRPPNPRPLARHLSLRDPGRGMAGAERLTSVAWH